MKRLYRSTQERQLSGLLGGLSEQYNIDVSILRIAVLVGGFFTGGTIWLIYILASMVVPTEKDLREKG